MNFYFSIELLIFVVMVATFVVAAMAFKIPIGLSMAIAAIAGAVVGGYGFPLRHLVEGMFSYVDTILVIATAMIFMKVVEKSGALDAITTSIVGRFHTKPALLLILVMLVVMFPAMITGSSTASVLSAGSIMAPVLIMMGIPAVETACILSFGGILGMIAPPVNIPAMIIGGGVDIPYVGFEAPLSLLTFPLAIAFVLYYGYKYAKNMDYRKVLPKLDHEIGKKYGFKLYLPIIVAIALMVINKVVTAIPDLGMPLVFIIASITGLFTGKKINVYDTSKEAINSVLSVLSILMGVGMFIQIMTLTGVRGYIVSVCLSMPQGWRYLAMAVSIPLFGAVSSFGASSVLGVPFLLALMSKDTIITAAGISLISGLGDLMPPTALAGIFAAQVVGLKDDYFPVLKKCLIPSLIIILWGLLIIMFSNKLAPIIGL